MTTFRLLILVFIYPGSVFAQDTIYWKSDRPLKWKDFKAKPVENTFFQALSSTGITYTVSYKQDITSFDARAFFIPGKSWQRQGANEDVLMHEQGHFNITEIFAQRIRRAAQDIKPGDKPVQKQVEIMAEKLIAEKNAMQKQYDEDTHFGLDHEQQSAWNEKIAGMLKEN